MNLLRRFLAPLAIANLTMILIVGQVLSYALYLLRGPEFLQLISLDPEKVFAGEWWRIITFPFYPALPMFDLVVLFIFGMIFFHIMGTALEEYFGTLNYNIFLGIGFGCTIAVALLSRAFGAPMSLTNAWIYGSVFLAFAYLHPEFQLSLYFLIPVKIKYLAWIQIAFTLLEFTTGLTTLRAGGWVTCLLLIAAHLNLLVFFGPGLFRRGLRTGTRAKVVFANLPGAAKKARHTCVTCGATELSHPDRDFRYCTNCEGTPAYCNEHLAGHEHRTGAKSERT